MVEKSGKIGENIYYIFDNITGTLTISGKGKISNSDFEFFNYREEPIIKNIIIGNGITEIETFAFCDCMGLESICISDSVMKIGNHAFEGCAELKKIGVSEKNTVYDSSNECNAIIETEANKLLLGCKETVIPDRINIIGYYAFSECVKLESIKIPNSVTVIE